MSENNPRAFLLTHRDGRETLHPMSEAATAYRDTAVSQTPMYDKDAIDRLNSDRLDMALMVYRLIRRMRAAREGRGHAAGDEALAAKALDYLQRKGLQASPLRTDAGPNKV